MTRFFPAANPQALRERALVLRDSGSLERALKFVERSCRVAESQKARFEQAQSGLVRAELREQLDLVSSDDELAAAKRELAQLTRLAEQE